MKYTVSFLIHGYQYIEVEANNVDEAQEKAQKIHDECNFNNMDEIDSFVYSVESKKGKVYKK